MRKYAHVCLIARTRNFACASIMKSLNHSNLCILQVCSNDDYDDDDEDDDDVDDEHDNYDEQ